METGKLKTIVIIMLLLVNVVFLVTIISSAFSSSMQEKRVIKELAGVLAENGIEIDNDEVPQAPDLFEITLGGSRENEAAFAGAVLGDAELITSEEDISDIYEGSAGTARFGRQEFLIELESPSAPAEASAAAASEKLLDTTGIEGEFVRGGEQSAEYACRFDGETVFNCRIIFTFENGFLSSVSGARVMADGTVTGDKKIMSATTALMNFLAAVKYGGYVCSRISDVDAGYALRISVTGEGKLVPAWRIDTDTGTYLVDGITGETELLDVQKQGS